VFRADGRREEKEYSRPQPLGMKKKAVPLPSDREGGKRVAEKKRFQEGRLVHVEGEVETVFSTEGGERDESVGFRKKKGVERALFQVPRRGESTYRNREGRKA